MVLNRTGTLAITFKRYCIVGIYIWLTACASLKMDESSQPNLIPAQVPQAHTGNESVDLAPSARPHSSTPRGHESPPKSVEQSNSGEVSFVQNPPPSSYEPIASPGDLMTTLLLKAKKAIGLQQWLRAQRSLEQALRVQPKSVETYILYGDVYAGMGLSEKADEMYKRAIFLSDND